MPSEPDDRKRGGRPKTGTMPPIGVRLYSSSSPLSTLDRTAAGLLTPAGGYPPARREGAEAAVSEARSLNGAGLAAGIKAPCHLATKRQLS